MILKSIFNFGDRKSICCLCLNKFDVEDLSPMKDGGSGGHCSECIKNET